MNNSRSGRIDPCDDRPEGGKQPRLLEGPRGEHQGRGDRIPHRDALPLNELDQGRAEIVPFQLDSDYGWDDGLICGGRMQILVDPVRDEATARYFGQLEGVTPGTRAKVMQAAAQAGMSVHDWLEAVLNKAL